MSLILALASLYITGKVISEVGKDVTKIPARKEILEDSKKGNFNVETQFENILKICDIKRKKHDSSVAVLPYTGYERCLEYIDNHHLSKPGDKPKFIRYYKKVLSKEIAQRQLEYDRNYFAIESEVRNLMNTNNWETVKFKHVNVFVSYSDVEKRVDDIYDNTFFGELAVGPAKIKESCSGNAYEEVWAVKVPVSMKYSLEKYYKVSAQRCGYIY